MPPWACRVRSTSSTVSGPAITTSRYVVNSLIVRTPRPAISAIWAAVVSSQLTTQPCNAVSQREIPASVRRSVTASTGRCPGSGMAKSTTVVVPPQSAATLAEA